MKHTKWGAQNLRMDDIHKKNETIVDETQYWR